MVSLLIHILTSEIESWVPRNSISFYSKLDFWFSKITLSHVYLSPQISHPSLSLTCWPCFILHFYWYIARATDHCPCAHIPTIYFITIKEVNCSFLRLFQCFWMGFGYHHFPATSIFLPVQIISNSMQKHSSISPQEQRGWGRTRRKGRRERRSMG